MAESGPTVIFVVDTSVTMTPVLLTLKNSIWNFVHKRASKLNDGTKFLLVTYGDSSTCVKAGWESSHERFLQAVQELEINHLPDLGGAISNAFRLLKTKPGDMENRNYGRGWLPFKRKATAIICFTSAQNSIIRKPSGGFDVIPDIVFPKRGFPGETLDSEWWDWSTRIFIGRIKFPGMCKAQGIEQSCIKRIHTACHSEAITVWNTLTGPSQIDKWLRCIWKDFCMKRVLLAEFSDVTNSVNPAAWVVHRDMFIVPARPKNIPGERFSGVWPFPEGYPVSPKLSTLAPRKPYPLVRLQLAKDIELVNLPTDAKLGRFPIDTYEVFSAKHFQFMLHNPDTRYCMYIFDSLRERQVGKPFGYMFFSSKKEKLYMVLGPYDYPWLFQHLQSFTDNSKSRWSKGVSLLNWKSALEAYLLNIPPYYVDIILSELTKLELGTFIPKLKRPPLSNSVITQLHEIDNFWKRQKNWKAVKKDEIRSQMPLPKSMSKFVNSSRRSRSLHMLQELREGILDEINGRIRSPNRAMNERGAVNMYDDHELPISLMGNMQYYKLKRNKLQKQVPEFRDPFDFSQKSHRMMVVGGNPFRKSRKKSAYPQVKHAHKKRPPPTVERPPKKRKLLPMMTFGSEPKNVDILDASKLLFPAKKPRKPSPI